ncbi:pyridoxamine 5-phosphate oxidase [Haloechinothrix sp. LS1_15]|uniref:pyridoxamine 5-phosphate oxidase n=1 Tax=Haloechinothrix sp. LS1_15 TaxID=2652248 RepID=UPI002945F04D|nr:pyridoxamine 5-phosphate oxidase [Haloechinothrix sp. LS1_15]MDV6014348.1 pyridoxamine 5-phosphate oxidase [Haloechinothrix sp. LS1_15]
MVSWAEIESDVPEFAARVRQRFDTGENKTLATLRRDGSPRISGTEAEFRDGELMLGMMPGSVKLADVRRDPRIALHCPTVEEPLRDDPSAWGGDAKVSGTVIAVDGEPGSEGGEGVSFAIDITEVVLTSVGATADNLVIESWHEGVGWRRRTRV